MRDWFGLTLAAILMSGLNAGYVRASTTPLCRLTGTYSDDYGSTTSIRGKKGTILNTEICPTAGTFRILDETASGFVIKGKNTTKSCGMFSANLTFMGSCSVFGGTVVVNGTGYSDTFTKIKKDAKASPAPSELIKGLRGSSRR